MPSHPSGPPAGDASPDPWLAAFAFSALDGLLRLADDNVVLCSRDDGLDIGHLVSGKNDEMSLVADALVVARSYQEMPKALSVTAFAKSIEDVVVPTLAQAPDLIVQETKPQLVLRDLLLATHTSPLASALLRPGSIAP